MIYSDEYRFVYLAPLKTGTSTLWDFLRKQYAAKLHNGNKHCFVIPESVVDYFTFLTVRNPYLRILSLYNDFKNYPWKIDMEVTMANVIRTAAPISNLIQGLRVDAVVHTENLDEDFGRLPFLKEQPKLPKTNRSVPFVKGFAREHQVAVYESQKADFEAFQYPTECPVPVFETWEETLNPI